jgi:hypothetical protein
MTILTPGDVPPAATEVISKTIAQGRPVLSLRLHQQQRAWRSGSAEGLLHAASLHLELSCASGSARAWCALGFSSQGSTGTSTALGTAAGGVAALHGSMFPAASEGRCMGGAAKSCGGCALHAHGCSTPLGNRHNGV